ncbi:MAG: hypothetical protein ACK5NK_06045 [Niabella sp.]
MNSSENNINDILNSLNSTSRAEAKPFMYTRVMSRLQQDEQSIWARTVSFIARPVVAIACLIAIIAANLYFVVRTENTDAEYVNTNVTNSVTEQFLQNDNLVLAVNSIEISE